MFGDEEWGREGGGGVWRWGGEVGRSEEEAGVERRGGRSGGEEGGERRRGEWGGGGSRGEWGGGGRRGERGQEGNRHRARPRMPSQGRHAILVNIRPGIKPTRGV